MPLCCVTLQSIKRGGSVMPFVGDLVIDSNLIDFGVGVVLDTWRDSHQSGYVQVMYFKGDNDDCMWSPVTQVKVISRGHSNESW